MTISSQTFGQQTISVVLNEGQMPAKLSTDSSGNTVLVEADGKELPVGATDYETPLLIIGGDHPYKQWYGTNGSNGMAALYNKYGIKPYIAINSDTAGSTVIGGTDMMTINELNALNVEIVGHGHRHYQDNTAPNSGIKVTYTGAAATATFQVTGGNAVGVTAGGVADFSFSLSSASYDTLTELKNAINAVNGWVCQIADELAGTEKSSLLFSSSTSRNAKSTTVKWAVGGGISLKWTGTTASNVYVTNDGSNIRVFGDGRHLGSTSASGTLTVIVTALNTITGVTAALSGSTTTDNYVDGTESGTNLFPYNGPLYLSSIPVCMDGGLSAGYMNYRNQLVNKEYLESIGYSATALAQSGGDAYSNFGNAQVFSVYRGNSSSPSSVGQVPQSFVDNFVPHIPLVNTIPQARAVAMIDALADSPGWVLTALIHKVQADGSTGYSFPTTDAAYYDQTESSLAAILEAYSGYKAAGKMRNVALGDINKYASSKRPKNFLFNPKFKNSGESLLSTAAAMPGWVLSGTGLSSASVSNGEYSVVTSSASTLLPIYQWTTLPPGVYEFSFDVDVSGYSSGSGVFGFITFNAIDNNAFTPGQTFVSEGYKKGNCRVSIRFAVPQPTMHKAKVISVAEPFNLSTNKNIQLNLDSIASIDNLDCSAGAVSASAVRAHEAAAAINAAIKANASYPGEYHTVARAENGYLIIEAPWVSNTYAKAVTVSSASTLNAISTIFGSSSTSVSYAKLSNTDWNAKPVGIGFGCQVNTGATVKVSNPRLRSMSAVF